MTTDTDVRQSVRASRGRGRGRVAVPELEEALEEPEVEEDLEGEEELDEELGAEEALEEAEEEAAAEEEEEEDEAQLGTARLAEETEEEEQEEAEAALDELLRLQLTGTAPEEAVLFEDEEVEARARPTDDGVQPRAADEFVCHGCFLVKSRTQLADSERSLCRDCADDARVR